MVMLGGWVFLMSEIPMYRGTSLKRSRDPFRITAGLYMGIPLIRTPPLLGPYSRTMPGVLGGSLGGGRFLVGEVPL